MITQTELAHLGDKGLVKLFGSRLVFLGLFKCILANALLDSALGLLACFKHANLLVVGVKEFELTVYTLNLTERGNSQRLG